MRDGTRSGPRKSEFVRNFYHMNIEAIKVSTKESLLCAPTPWAYYNKADYTGPCFSVSVCDANIAVCLRSAAMPYHHKLFQGLHHYCSKCALLQEREREREGEDEMREKETERERDRERWRERDRKR